MMRRILWLPALLALFLAVPAAAQQRPDSTSAPQVRAAERQALLATLQAFVDSLSAPPGYVREVFTYPRYGRLDPVEPPTTVTQATAFPELALTGIVFDQDDPRKSAAIIRVSKDGETLRRVVRAGDTVGQYRIVAVRRTYVEIDVYLYGGIRRITLDRTSGSGTL